MLTFRNGNDYVGKDLLYTTKLIKKWENELVFRGICYNEFVGKPPNLRYIGVWIMIILPLNNIALRWTRPEEHCSLHRLKGAFTVNWLVIPGFRCSMPLRFVTVIK